VLGISGWNDTGCGGGGPLPTGDNGVSVEPTHVDGLASGKPSNPIVVNRDNPWFQGWHSAPAGSWATGSGSIYANEFDGSCGGKGLGTVSLYEFAPRPYEVDAWQTPLRPIFGHQSTSAFGQTWLNWAVRTGNFVPDDEYAVTQQNCAGHTKPATWFRLASDVLVVPVILISWLELKKERDKLIAKELGPAASGLIEQLQPVVTSFGYLNCPWTGNTVVDEHVAEVDSAPPGFHDVRMVPAHELGHLLLGGGHEGPPSNLMYGDGDPGTELTELQCANAQAKAAEFAERYRAFNQAIGRAAPLSRLAP